MHDIDRTLTELENETETETEYNDDYENEFEEEHGGGYGREGEFEDEDLGLVFDDDEFEWESANGDTFDRKLLSDEEEMELASDLLNASSDEELEQFLGKLSGRIRKRVRGLVKRGRTFFKKGVGRKLGRALRRVAKRVLPTAGRAAGGVFGGPVGAALGGRAGSAVGKVLGLELEGLSPEDQEFEAAKRVVRLAADSMANAVAASQGDDSADDIVRNALTRSARRHAPGLLARPTETQGDSHGRSGRWIRRGKTIVLLGA